MKKLHIFIFMLHAIATCQAILREETGKDLPTNYNNDDILARKRRPLGGIGGLAGAGGGGSGCNFNGIRGERPKSQGMGRTFFDLQFLNVGYHHNYNINCGGTGGGYPPVGGHNPIQGGGVQSQAGSLPNKKPILSMILANRPLQGLFSQSQSQTQTGILGDTVSSLVSLLPKPQDIGQGLGEGITSFVQTLPQIGQSFQSLLPSFDNFQFPSLPSIPPLTQAGSQSQSQSMAFGGPATPPQSTVTVVTPAAPDLVTEPTVDPDDIIYNDDVKPVHENPDVVAGPHKLPPGAYYNRNYAQNRYQSYKNYHNQRISSQNNRNRYHYQQNRPVYNQREPRYRQDADIFSEEKDSRDQNGRLGSRTFRFPT